MKDGYIDFKEYKTYYRIVGESYKNPPIILLHGGPGSTHNYMESLDEASDILKCPLISYDQLGCGNSFVEGHEELWNMKTWIEELINLIEKLGLKKYYLLGQSFGGMMTLEYTCNYKHDGLLGIILSSTLPSSIMWKEEGMRMVKDLPLDEQMAIEYALKNEKFDDIKYLKAVDDYMDKHCFGSEWNEKFECLRRPKISGKYSYSVAWGPNEFAPMGNLISYDVCDKLEEIDVPTLIMSGGRDMSTPYINKYMNDHIKNSRWHLFPNARHMCFIENNKEYIEILVDFVDKIAKK